VQLTLWRKDDGRLHLLHEIGETASLQDNLPFGGCCRNRREAHLRRVTEPCHASGGAEAGDGPKLLNAPQASPKGTPKHSHQTRRWSVSSADVGIQRLNQHADVGTVVMSFSLH
jgi:hypothetical protein